MDQQQQRDEEHFRRVERALLYVDDAARKIAKIAEDLRGDGADPHLVAALEVASESVRADHRQLMKSVYFRAPDSGAQQNLLAEDPPERLAS